ncbi:MAG: UDP-glucose/GDP-mannose dehydrogenase family protein [Bacteroidales bacterium]|jgi:UDPglucose 6-dehydrogenase|nr:UDP-glucose/GDP-mannose dehydrogenase family protein [Bacteroidales bacterium]
MKISIVGTGYVGLVSGTCFSETGVTTTCVDIDKKKIENLNKGIIPIYEPGLEGMVVNNIEKNRLFFTTSLKDSIKNADAVFIAVGTPPDEDGSADLQYVLSVAKEIGENMEKYMVIITKSTVPVHTAKKVKDTIQKALDKRAVNIDFDVASNPEFLKEGDAINDFLKPDRIVVGVETEKAENVIRRLYHPFTAKNYPLIIMDITSAELTKYTANSMLATKISFMNDISQLCELVGADVDAVRRGIGSDTRIGEKFIFPGAGYGGSCFPKDVQALIRTSKQNGHKLEILEAVEAVNYRQKEVMFQKIEKHFKGNLKGKKIGLWGLAFKPNTDDMREAPALVVIDKLVSAGAEVVAYDPAAMDETKRKIGDKIKYADDQYEAIVDADALLIMTEWAEFRLPKYTVIEKLLKKKVIFDGRNLYNPKEMKEFGYTYYCVGRK